MTRNSEHADTIEESNDVENDEDDGNALSVSTRAVDALVVDVQHESGASLVVQPGEGGYKLDSFWENNNKQANNWVTFTDDVSDSGYDNRHERAITGEVRSDPETVVITDPEPRGEHVGYDDATLEIQFVDDVGFFVKLYWTNNENEQRKSFAIAPLFDPREFESGDRAKFYETVEYNQSNLDVEDTINTYTPEKAT